MRTGVLRLSAFIQKGGDEAREEMLRCDDGKAAESQWMRR